MCLARRLFLIERTEASGKSLSEWCAPVFRAGETPEADLSLLPTRLTHT